ncbi:MAG: amidase [Solirubrobacteraceae bacterium]
MSQDQQQAISQQATSMTVTRSDADGDLAFAGLTRLAELLHHGQLTPRELTELYLRRIERFDSRLGSFVRVRADAALADADAALTRLRAGERSSLLGIPVAVKDNLDVAGEPTAHGTSGAHQPAASDCEVVRRLRAAGAIILGKTALCQLAAWGHFTASEAHGVTRNPWNTERSPGGSSGGSAVAVAAGLAPVALGSDGGGSIRIPSAFCGLFGLKPQRGRIPLAPTDDHWYGCTVLGGMGRSVSDVAILDDVLCTPPAEPHGQPAGSFSESVGLDPGRLRIAYSLKPAIPGVKPSPQAILAIEQTVELLRSLGHEVSETKLAHPQLLVTFTPRWTAGVADDAGLHPDGLDRRTRRVAATGRRLHGRALRRSLDREADVARRLNAVFDTHDLVMTPTTAAAPPPADISQGNGAFRTFNQGSPYVCYTPTWNYVGQPAASVPAGFDDEGLPLAVQLAAPPNGETAIIALAAQIETARPWTQHRPTLGLAPGDGRW